MYKKFILLYNDSNNCTYFKRRQISTIGSQQIPQPSGDTVDEMGEMGLGVRPKVKKEHTAKRPEQYGMQLPRFRLYNQVG